MNRSRGRAVSGAFVFLLLGMFAVFAIVLVMVGARAYQATVNRTEQHAEARILESYIANALRADDAAHTLSVREIDGMQTLHFSYDFGEDAYEKYIYCHDGSLRELFTSDDYGFDADSGEIICPAQDMEINANGRLITAVITDACGESHRTQLALRCAE